MQSLQQFYTHNEYGHPGQADVVERYGALERILSLRLALSVVIIPVDTRPVGKGHGGRGIANQSIVSSRGRQVETRMHSVVVVFRTDVILFLVVQRIVRWQHPEKITYYYQLYIKARVLLPINIENVTYKQGQEFNAKCNGILVLQENAIQVHTNCFM